MICACPRLPSRTGLHSLARAGRHALLLLPPLHSPQGDFLRGAGRAGDLLPPLRSRGGLGRGALALGVHPDLAQPPPSLPLLRKGRRQPSITPHAVLPPLRSRGGLGRGALLPWVFTPTSRNPSPPPRTPKEVPLGAAQGERQAATPSRQPHPPPRRAVAAGDRSGATRRGSRCATWRRRGPAGAPSSTASARGVLPAASRWR